MKRQKTKSKVDVYALDQLLNFKNLDTSYKLFWVKGILDEVQEGNKTISYQRLALRMVAESWEYVVHKGIQFSREDRLHRMAEEIDTKWNIASDLTKEELLTTLEGLWDEDMTQIVSELYEDTPYRLFEPLFEKALKGQKERDKNAWLQEKINAEGNLLYTIMSDQKKIQISKDWEVALKNNYKAIEGIYRDNLAYLLRDAGLGKSIRYSLK
ncbi:MAG: hypothetical protein ACRCTE_08325 [Cellulosilyticaceae bacterium]